VEFRKYRLDNGLELIAECNPRAYSVAVAFFVRTGARDETDDIAGVSHFLEHMAFKGTARRSAADVNRELDEIGGFANAFTSEEQTVYYVSVLPEYQERAIDILADIMRPALRSEDFVTEKDVILKEIARYDNQPPFGAQEKSMALHFRDHPLRRSVLGTVESVGNLSVEQMRDYFEERYCPNNMTVAVAGNIDFEKLVSLIEDCCGDWSPRRVKRLTPRARPNTDCRAFPHDVATLQYLIQTANGPAAEDDDRHAAHLLTTIVGDESGSRFFWDLVDPGLADYAVMYAAEFQGTGVYSTMLSCEPDDTAANLKRIREILERIQDEGVKPEELEQACNKICAHIVLQSEKPTQRMFSLGNAWLQRHEYITVRQLVDAYRTVTLDDIRAVLNRFPLTVFSTVAVGPLHELDLR